MRFLLIKNRVFFSVLRSLVQLVFALESKVYLRETRCIIATWIIFRI